MTTTSSAVSDRPSMPDLQPTDPFAIALAKPETRPLDKADAVRRIQRETGMSALAILTDLIRLARGPGRVQLSDYVRLRLFDAARWDGRDRFRVVGEKQNELITALVNREREWVAMLTNKVAATAYLGAYGLPVAPTLAIWQRGGNPGGSMQGEPVLLTREAELVTFLSDPSHYPLFGKPIDGLQSLGAIALGQCLPGGGYAIASDGGMLPIARLAAEIAERFEDFVFQPKLSPHPALAPLSAGHLATVRLLTLHDGSGAQVLRGCVKLNVAGNAADNYWRSGNLLAPIDMATGTLGDATTALGFDLMTVARHPDTGAPIAGTVVPGWPAVLEIGVAAATAMRRVPLIGWDIGIGEAGPVIIEMNDTPDFLLPQLADSAGLLEPALVEVLRRCPGLDRVIDRRRLALLS